MSTTFDLIIHVSLLQALISLQSIRLSIYPRISVVAESLGFICIILVQFFLSLQCWVLERIALFQY